MAKIGTAQGRHLFDMSFMASLHCDLECSFCMYDSSPRVNDSIDLNAVSQFLYTVDFSIINAFGLYGGEPSLRMRENSSIISMLPPNKPVFVITNGTWSRSEKQRRQFLGWQARHGLHVIVSGTAEHIRHQDRLWLEEYAKSSPERFRLKKAETSFIPMGRLGHLPTICTQKCDTDSNPTRIAMKPNGDIIFQTCDGSYPVVGRAEEGFPAIQKRLVEKGWQTACPVWRPNVQNK